MDATLQYDNLVKVVNKKILNSQVLNLNHTL